MRKVVKHVRKAIKHVRKAIKPYVKMPYTPFLENFFALLKIV